MEKENTEELVKVNYEISLLAKENLTRLKKEFKIPISALVDSLLRFDENSLEKFIEIYKKINHEKINKYNYLPVEGGGLVITSEIGSRFDKALSILQITNKEISEFFNTSSQNISNLKKTDRVNDLMSQIAARYKININWLVTGQGDMFINTHINSIYHSTEQKYYINTPDDIISDLDNLFSFAKKQEKMKELIKNFDDFFYTQKKLLRE